MPDSYIYLLELSVLPGGARKCDYYVADNVQTVVDFLRADLTQESYLAICYGETIMLHICKYVGNEHYDIAFSFDLHSCLTFNIADFPPIRFDSDNCIEDEESCSEDKYLDNEDPIDFSKINTEEIGRYLWSDQFDESSVSVQIDLTDIQLGLNDLQIRKLTTSEVRVKIEHEYETLDTCDVNSFE